MGCFYSSFAADDNHHHHHHHSAAGSHSLAHKHEDKHHQDVTKKLNRLIADAPIPEEMHFNNGNEVWHALKQGNALFTNRQRGAFLLNVANGVSAKKRARIASSQRPHAIVVCCSDSRVSPELVFNQGLGDLFVVRVAGTVVDQVTLGSIEYAVEHLHPKLLVVLGHQHCGAVQAAVDSYDYHRSHKQNDKSNNIQVILDHIYPSVAKAKADKGLDIVPLAIHHNTKHTAKQIVKHSHIVDEHVQAGELVICAAVYSLDTGEVTKLE